MECVQHQSATTQEPAIKSGYPVRTRGFSTEAQWVKYQPVIKKLYVDEGRTLQDVMEIMKRDYGFDVT